MAGASLGDDVDSSSKCCKLDENAGTPITPDMVHYEGKCLEIPAACTSFNFE